MIFPATCTASSSVMPSTDTPGMLVSTMPFTLSQVSYSIVTGVGGVVESSHWVVIWVVP